LLILSQIRLSESVYDLSFFEFQPNMEQIFVLFGHCYLVNPY
jgi:hypothetical protein